jgi:hypothetical protein
MPNLSALGPITTTATALSNLVLVSPQSTIGYQPQNDPDDDGTVSTAAQPAALLFHYEGEQTALLESDITDHYVEDNTARQDQIALKPVIITTHGFIGELNDVTPSFLKPVKFAADKLTTIGAYVPKISVTAQIAYAEAFQLYQVAQAVKNSAVSAWNNLTGQGGESVINGQGVLSPEANQNKQQVMFQQFYGYYSSRQLFTVQTPWAVFQDMAIKSLRAIQDASTDVITDFEVTFKQIRTASTTTGSLSATLSGRASAQGAAATNLGSSSGAASTSLPSALSSMGAP